MKGYYFITDSRLSRAGNESDVRNAVKAGVKVIQYRNKDASTKEMLKEAQALHKLCRSAKFLINDRVDIALAVGVDGVHLGQDDMPYQVARKLLGKKKIIGLTVHSLAEAQAAEKGGADYIGISPIFATATKPDAQNPVGVAMIRKIRAHVSLPIIAIGGITLTNAHEVVRAGADGLCAISAVVTSKDPRKEMEKFQSFFCRRKSP